MTNLFLTSQVFGATIFTDDCGQTKNAHPLLASEGEQPDPIPGVHSSVAVPGQARVNTTRRCTNKAENTCVRRRRARRASNGRNVDKREGARHFLGDALTEMGNLIMDVHKKSCRRPTSEFHDGSIIITMEA